MKTSRYIPRLITERLSKLFQTFPVVVVSGARQVGKSTLVQHQFGDIAQCVVFDPVKDVENARHDPDLFLDNRRTPLILDEIQYAPELVAAIKRRIDRNRTPGQYILTGSQQWGVMKTMVESLAGRAVFLDLEGFSLGEAALSDIGKPWFTAWLENPDGLLPSGAKRLKLNRSVFDFVWRGWLPEAQFIPLEAIPDFHAAYQRTYIERDVRLLADIADLQLFGRFVRLASALTAQEINYSQMGRELGLSPETSKRWLGILGATFQWYEHPPFCTNINKRLSTKPKGYIADTGIACAGQAISTPHALGGHPLWGALFESAVIGDIRKQCAILAPPPRFYHWRTHGGAEVDLLVERDGIFFPVEIKGAAQVTRRDASGIDAFRQTYPNLRIAKGLVIGPIESVYPLSHSAIAVPWDLAG